MHVRLDGSTTYYSLRSPSEKDFGVAAGTGPSAGRDPSATTTPSAGRSPPADPSAPATAKAPNSAVACAAFAAMSLDAHVAGVPAAFLHGLYQDARRKPAENATRQISQTEQHKQRAGSVHTKWRPSNVG